MFLWPKFLRNKELGYKAIPQTMSKTKPTAKVVNVRIKSCKPKKSDGHYWDFKVSTSLAA